VAFFIELAENNFQFKKSTKR